MRYQIKEKFWSWGDAFFILNEQGNEVFQVKGKAFSWGDKLSFQDLQGYELAFIEQKLMSWKPTYEIYREGKFFAQLKKEVRWFSKEFSLDVPGPNDYTIQGSFWRHEYEFIRGGRTVALVEKARWTLNDSYGVDIVQGEDNVAVLCAAIVIDEILEDEQARRNS